MTVSRNNKTEIGFFFNSHTENNIIKLMISLFGLSFTPLVSKKSYQVKSTSSELTLDIALMSLYIKRWIWEHLKTSVVSAQLRQALLIRQSNIIFYKLPQNTRAAPWEPHSADWYCPSLKHLRLEGRKLFIISPLPCMYQSLISLPYYQKSTHTIRHSNISRSEVSFQSPVGSRSG